MLSLTNRPISAGGCSRGVGIEDFEEMAKPLALGLDAEGAVGVQRAAVEIDVVVEGDGIEPQVGPEAALARLALGPAALDVIDRGGAERLRGLAAVVARAGGQPDVGRVVGPHGRGDAAVVEQPLVDREHLVRAGAHQHDVDESLGDDLANLLADTRRACGSGPRRRGSPGCGRGRTARRPCRRPWRRR